MTLPSTIMTFSVATNVGSPSVGSVAISNGSVSAFATSHWSSYTACDLVTNVDNYPVASPAYTFATSYNQALRILGAQCNRVHNYIHGQLENVDRSDDDQNEMIVDKIARVIDLVGEPASCTAVFEAELLKNNPNVFEPLVLAIGTARNKESEADRVQALRRYANDSNNRVKRAAVRALGRMDAPAARVALNDINRNGTGEVAQLAAAMLR
jgi:hypothetical protein